MNKPILFCLCMSLLGSFYTAASQLKGTEFEAKFSSEKIEIDGQMSEASWQQGDWYPMFEDMIGQPINKQDFNGRFKLRWDNGHLYLLAEITDDVLFDQHADPLFLYWDDDCLEVFIDEDRSGGNHQFNYNAFAYHIALDNQVVDIGEKTKQNPEPFLTLNDHVKSVWKRSATSPNTIIWELAIKVYDDTFKPELDTAPVQLHEGKKLGFMLAYCDNDGSKSRENFVGSTSIKPVNGDKNLGYITADVFANLTLVKAQ